MAEPSEDVLGPAVWAACKDDQRHVLERWLRRTAVADVHATSRTEPAAALAKVLQIDVRHARALAPQQLVFAYLNYLRIHFKSADEEVPVPAPVASGPVKKRALLQSEPVWSNNDFPPLSTPTPAAHIVASKPKSQKDKRRIRSTLVSTPSQTSMVPVTSSAFTSAPKVNVKARLPALGKDVLSKFETRLTTVTHGTCEKTLEHPEKEISTEEESPQGGTSHQPNDTPTPELDEPAEELEPLGTPTPMALFYSFLLQAQLVPQSAVELQWLFTLLSHESAEAKEFALTVFYTIPETLELYGIEILQLIIDTFSRLHVARSLQVRFLHFIEAYEEARSTESQAVGTSLPVEVHGNNARDFAVPFCEDTDSRLHFRSPAEAVLFSNREKARDSFLALLRQWQKQRQSIDGTSSSLDVEMRASLDEVSPENHWWFAQFFVQELCQVGINPVGEHDKDLVQKIMHDDKLKNPDRLRKLHQRFTSQQQPKGSAKLQAPMKAKVPAPTTVDNGGGVDASIFPDNQLFFAQYLHATNHAVFTRLVTTVLEAQLRQIAALWGAASPSVRKTFTLQTLQAKLLGKFLGYLHYAPFWHMPGLTNPAMESARKQAIAIRNHTRAPLDVLAALRQSVEEHTLMASLPWILEYLRMVLKDSIGCATTYVQTTIAHVQMLYHAPRLQSSRSENGLLLRLQLEAFLHAVSSEPSLTPAVLDAATISQEYAAALDASTTGLDAMPYLACSMFVAHCVPDVPALRAFLLHFQASKTSKASSGRRLKVRPLTLSMLKGDDDVANAEDEVPALKTSIDDPLTRAFFKQYPSVQRTIEFVVDTTMTNVCQIVAPDVVVPAANTFMDKVSGDLDDFSTDAIAVAVRRHISGAKLAACALAVAAAEPYCQEHIPRVLKSLLAPSIDERVRTMAVALATQKAVGSLRTVVAASMGMEFSKQVVQRVRKLAKPGPAPVASAPPLLDTLHAAAKDLRSAAHVERFALLLKLSREPTGGFSVVVWCCIAAALDDAALWRLDAPDALATLLHQVFERHAWHPSALAVLDQLVRLWLQPEQIAHGLPHLEALCSAFPELHPRTQAIFLDVAPSATADASPWLVAAAGEAQTARQVVTMLELPVANRFFPPVHLNDADELHLRRLAKDKLRLMTDLLYGRQAQSLVWKPCEGQTADGCHVLKAQFVDVVPATQDQHTCVLYRASVVVQATVPEVMSVLACPKTEDYRRMMRALYGLQFLDGFCLHTLPRKKLHRPNYFYTALKWCALATRPGARGSDFCFLEYAGIRKDEGSLMGFCIQQSIALDTEVPDLSQHGLQREAFLRTGILVTPTDRDGLVRVTSFCQVQNASLSPSVPADLEELMRHRVLGIRGLQSYVERGRLGRQPFVERWRWVRNEERKTCALCVKTFMFRRRHHCRQCGEVVCSTCAPYREVDTPTAGPNRVRICHRCTARARGSDQRPLSESILESSVYTDDGSFVISPATTPARLRTSSASSLSPRPRVRSQRSASMGEVSDVAPPTRRLRDTFERAEPPSLEEAMAQITERIKATQLAIQSSVSSREREMQQWPTARASSSSSESEPAPELPPRRGFPLCPSDSDDASCVSFHTSATDHTECPFAPDNYALLMGQLEPRDDLSDFHLELNVDVGVEDDDVAMSDIGSEFFTMERTPTPPPMPTPTPTQLRHQPPPMTQAMKANLLARQAALRASEAAGSTVSSCLWKEPVSAPLPPPPPSLAPASRRFRSVPSQSAPASGMRTPAKRERAHTERAGVWMADAGGDTQAALAHQALAQLEAECPNAAERTAILQALVTTFSSLLAHRQESDFCVLNRRDHAFAAVLQAYPSTLKLLALAGFAIYPQRCVLSDFDEFLLANLVGTLKRILVDPHHRHSYYSNQWSF
ncbi:hypothetical protein ACHHYP_00306 [Achlya hypogyna]|uniref:FYVE-type domain-containing protein n=1 Tax=Achlya hypogyna TaxID=1202772 RepID=A0A1V9ZUJ5_ACHHY|nr:hypothetical protein ACHHYP_00306 [Achlya hypogyna]